MCPPDTTGGAVLQGVDLAFAPGQVLALIGPNGSGKSTLLRAALGLVPCLGGEVLYDGVPLRRLSARQVAQKAAFLSQSRAVPNLSAQRMVLHGRFPHLSYPRHYREEDRRIVRQALAAVDAADLAARPVTELSGGQRQKVYLAMAIAQQTPSILMDEPTTFLDIAHQLGVMELSPPPGAPGQGGRAGAARPAAGAVRRRPAGRAGKRAAGAVRHAGRNLPERRAGAGVRHPAGPHDDGGRVAVLLSPGRKDSRTKQRGRCERWVGSRFLSSWRGARGLLVGGGRVALRKAEKLLPFGAQLTVVAPCICPPLAALPGLTLCRRAFADSDLSPAPDFVIAATGDRALDRRIAALCRTRRILVNVVDDPAACGFYFPALVQRGRLCIGISTGGASPTAAAWLRQKIEALLPPGFDGILDRLAARREAVKAEGGSEAKRAERLQQAFALELAAAEAPHAPAAARGKRRAGPCRAGGGRMRPRGPDHDAGAAASAAMPGRCV